MYRFPFTPYPNGWFRLAYSHQVKRRGMRRVTALGREFVVFRGNNGEASILDAFCPHLGADLSVGGKVVGNAIECPFHGWQFAGDGRCVKIPACDRIPKKASLRSWPVTERDGVIYVWYDAEDRAPAFEVPEGPYRAGVHWSKPMYFRWLSRMHVQEVVENAVDTTHFPSVHAYGKPPVVKELVCKDHTFSVSLETMRKGMNFVGPSPITIRYTGMGFTTANLTARLGGNLELEAAVLLNTTPLSSEYCEITIKACYRKSWNPLWNLIVAPFMRNEIAKDFKNDIPIWEAKRYYERPLLSKADGPIPEVRRWCRQFYTEQGLTAGKAGLTLLPEAQVG
jgi:nitrite reductase/ring-hydroxylating ferredoxin subunit